MQLFPSFHLQQRMLERGLDMLQVLDAVRYGTVFVESGGTVGIFTHKKLKVVVNLEMGKIITAYKKACAPKKIVKKKRRERERRRYAT